MFLSFTQMSSFKPEMKPPTENYETVEHPMYLLARDEDCENTFHSSADFVRIFLKIMNRIYWSFF